MPMVIQTAERYKHRFFWHGKSGAGKTESLLTLPSPIAIVSFPGEKGYRTATDCKRDDVTVWRWEEDDIKGTQSTKLVDIVEKTCLDIIASGKYQSIGLDGLHKYVHYALDAVTGGLYFDPEVKEFDRKSYGVCYRKVNGFLNRLSYSKIPVMAVTAWSDARRTRGKMFKDEKGDDIPTTIMPDLLGQMHKEIMGEWDVVLYQSWRKEKPGDAKEIPMWQTRATELVGGCAIKGRRELVEKIPTYIPAVYSELIKVLEG